MRHRARVRARALDAGSGARRAPEAIRLAPEVPAHCDSLAWTLEEQGRYDEAGAAIEEAQRLSAGQR